jgi:DNA-directed RNA polymerase subunit M
MGRYKASPIEFCDKCKAIMVPEKKGKSIHLKCIRCGSKKRKSVKILKIVDEKKKIKGITILEKDETPLPITDNECPKCGNIKAYWWMQQTRSADEPPTQFFRCVKCKHTWREYK